MIAALFLPNTPLAHRLRALVKFIYPLIPLALRLNLFLRIGPLEH